MQDHLDAPDPAHFSHPMGGEVFRYLHPVQKSRISLATLISSPSPDVLGVNDIFTLIDVLFLVLMLSLVISKYEVNDDLVVCCVIVAEDLLI